MYYKNKYLNMKIYKAFILCRQINLMLINWNADIIESFTFCLSAPTHSVSKAATPYCLLPNKQQSDL